MEGLYLHLMHVHGPYDAPEPLVELARASDDFGPSRRLVDAELEAAGPSGRARSGRAICASGACATPRGCAPSMPASATSWKARAGRAGSRTPSSSSPPITARSSSTTGGWNHGATLFDEQLHVPLLVRLPGGDGGGRRVDSIVSLVDLTPTLELAGLPALPDRQDAASCPSCATRRRRRGPS